MSRFQCVYCKRILSNRFNQNRHQSTCDKKEWVEILAQNQQLQQELSELREQHRVVQEEHQVEMDKLRLENERLLKQVDIYDQLTDRMQEQLNTFLS